MREICLGRTGWDEEGKDLEVAPDNREWGDLLFSCTLTLWRSSSDNEDG
jgi:hypothetical protein